VTLSRVEVKSKVVAILDSLSARDDHPLNGVVITYNAPTKGTVKPKVAGPKGVNAAVIVGAIEGEYSTQAFSWARTAVKDSWTIRCVVIVTGIKTEIEADVRCEEIVNAIGDALFIHPRLDTTEGGTGALPAVAIDPDTYDGPNAGSTDGSVIESWAALTFRFRASL
jgi:hypothetical protein